MIPTIPETAYNFWSKNNSIQLVDGERWYPSRSNFYTLIQENFEGRKIPGSVLYNPLGGIDVGYQFGLSPDISDVVSQGAQEFGTAEDILANLADAVWGIGLKVYDRNQNLDSMERLYGGVGTIAINRIFFGLEGDITGLYYFSLTDEGIRFVDQPTEQAPNAVVTFEDPHKERRFWYLQERFSDDSNKPIVKTPFFDFVANLDFDTLLIKAAYPLWNRGAHPEIVFDVMLDPARERDAYVVTDGNEEHILFEPIGRPIWREGFQPERFQPVGIRFGYGSYVFTGNGRELAHRNEPKIMEEILARKSNDRFIKENPNLFK